MAVYKIFPTKDASIYSYYPSKNTGIDEILDIPFGEDRLIGGTKGKDKQPIFYNSHKWFPGLGGVVRFFDLFNSDVSYENAQ